jgi:hypothetical protein
MNQYELAFHRGEIVVDNQYFPGWLRALSSPLLRISAWNSGSFPNPDRDLSLCKALILAY